MRAAAPEVHPPHHLVGSASVVLSCVLRCGLLTDASVRAPTRARRLHCLGIPWTLPTHPPSAHLPASRAHPPLYHPLDPHRPHPHADPPLSTVSFSIDAPVPSSHPWLPTPICNWPLLRLRPVSVMAAFVSTPVPVHASLTKCVIGHADVEECSLVCFRSVVCCEMSVRGSCMPAGACALMDVGHCGTAGCIRGPVPLRPAAGIAWHACGKGGRLGAVNGPLAPMYTRMRRTVAVSRLHRGADHLPAPVRALLAAI